MSGTVSVRELGDSIKVVTIAKQGLPGPQLAMLSAASDADLVTRGDGSVLSYDEVTQKWRAKSQLSKLVIDANLNTFKIRRTVDGSDLTDGEFGLSDQGDLLMRDGETLKAIGGRAFLSSAGGTMTGALVLNGGAVIGADQALENGNLRITGGQISSIDPDSDLVIVANGTGWLATGRLKASEARVEGNVAVVGNVAGEGATAALSGFTISGANNRLRLKTLSVADQVPTLEQVENGELVINTADGLLYTLINGSVGILGNPDAKTLGGFAPDDFSKTGHLHDDRYVRLSGNGGDYYTQAEVASRINDARLAVIGGAGADYATLGKVQQRIQADAERLRVIESTFQGSLASINAGVAAAQDASELAVSARDIAISSRHTAEAKAAQTAADAQTATDKAAAALLEANRAGVFRDEAVNAAVDAHAARDSAQALYGDVTALDEAVTLTTSHAQQTSADRTQVETLRQETQVLRDQAYIYRDNVSRDYGLTVIALEDAQREAAAAAADRLAVSTDRTAVEGYLTQAQTAAQEADASNAIIESAAYTTQLNKLATSTIESRTRLLVNESIQLAQTNVATVSAIQEEVALMRNQVADMLQEAGF